MASNEYREKCLEAKGRVCDICESDEDIEVHHIDGDRTNDRLENLIPLCAKHHKEIHNGSLELDEYDDLRPGTQTATMVQITVRLTKENLRQVDETVDGTHRSRADLIREYVDQGLDEEEMSKANAERYEGRIRQLEQQLERSESLVDRLIEKL